MSEQEFSIREALQLAVDTGINVELGLHGGFKFSDTVVEQIRGNVIRILLEADQAGEPDRAMVAIAAVAYVLYS